MEKLVNSLCASYEPDAVVFPYRPVGEHLIARQKYPESQMAEYWAMDEPAYETLHLTCYRWC
jgi:hypothetical protein